MAIKILPNFSRGHTIAIGSISADGVFIQRFDRLSVYEYSSDYPPIYFTDDSLISVSRREWIAKFKTYPKLKAPSYQKTDYDTSTWCQCERCRQEY